MNCLVLFMKTCHLLFVKKKTVINEWSKASFVMIICPPHSALSPKTEENKSTDLLMYVAADILTFYGGLNALGVTRFCLCTQYITN